MILFIDDETRAIDSFIEELKFSNYEVVLKPDVDSAFKYFQDNYDKIELIILDIMMPPGNKFQSVDTNDGCNTGHCFYQEIRKKYPQIPVILFTNFSLNEELEKEINQDKNSRFLHKPDFLPFELAEEIKSFLGER